MASKPARRPTPATTARRHPTRGRDDQARTDQDSTHTGKDEPRSETRDSAPVARETYAQRQERLDAEAVDRWAVIVEDWPPMTEQQIRALAVILNRIDARQHRPGSNGTG
jgi:hypothetical protein